MTLKPKTICVKTPTKPLFRTWQTLLTDYIINTGGELYPALRCLSIPNHYKIQIPMMMTKKILCDRERERREVVVVIDFCIWIKLVPGGRRKEERWVSSSLQKQKPATRVSSTARAKARNTAELLEWEGIRVSSRTPWWEGRWGGAWRRKCEWQNKLTYHNFFPIYCML